MDNLDPINSIKHSQDLQNEIKNPSEDRKTKKIIPSPLSLQPPSSPPTINNPHPNVDSSTKELIQVFQTTLNQVPDTPNSRLSAFSKAEVNVDNFSAHIFMKDPHYKFSLTIGENRLDLQGMGVRSDGSSIGVGGYGKVFVEKEGNIAVKAIEFNSKSSNPERLEKEARLMLKMAGSQNVVGAREVAVTENHMFIVMDMISGDDLFEAMPTLNFQKKINVLQDIVKGLTELHNKGIIHKDLKLDNILVTKDKTWLVDLGLAAEVTDQTKEGSGSPSYMSPEALKKEIQGIPSDIFSFGAVMHGLLTGTPIDLLNFSKEKKSIQAFKNRTSNDTCPDKTYYNDRNEIPVKFRDPLREIVLDCLKLNPNDRISLQEISEKLQSIYDDITSDTNPN